MRKESGEIGRRRVQTNVEVYGELKEVTSKGKMPRNNTGVRYEGVPPRAPGVDMNHWHQIHKMESDLAEAEGSHFEDMHREVFGHVDGHRAQSHNRNLDKWSADFSEQQLSRATLVSGANEQGSGAGRLRHSPATFPEDERQAFPKQQIDLVVPVTPEMPPSSSATITGTETIDPNGDLLDMALCESDRAKKGTESDQAKKDSSRKSRLKRNRESAKASRHKKKKELNDLEAQNKTLRDRVEELKYRKEQLTRNRDNLKRRADSVSKVSLPAH